ncbi:aminofutalosine synthase MqnE [Desulfovibrio sp. OttesenSCG-928-A18]|nr:aminofutalosine synthase MqnE [Desulfovibrio sp. OttesenSCG-928-A18]
MFDRKYYRALGLEDVYQRVLHGERLSEEQGDLLFACPDILAVGALAHHARKRLHGRKTYYVRNRHINYSNICVNHCRFCAFRRDAGEKGAFTLGQEDILERIQDDQGHPFAEIHVVGGCHPDLALGWFEELFRKIRKLRPEAIIKAFTVAEIAHFARQEGCDTAGILARLKEAGLAMLTGGGAEIFNPELRERICPEKISGREYLSIAGEAHARGIASNCSMLFGHIESHGDRVRHLCALRGQQDKSGGFVCFIPLPFQPEHNELARKLSARGRASARQTARGLDNLRTIAVARLLLDNIPHIKAYWVMLGVKCAQAALHFGADDLDGTIMEEHIGHMAGADSAQAMTRRELEEMIAGCGFTPVNRDALFTPLDPLLDPAPAPCRHSPIKACETPTPAASGVSPLSPARPGPGAGQ